ncbi:MAG TPA: hypothetical protein VJR89_07945 [Polyangiales bacterium]|nr:hypothetical protein [Polyangiales bacterium]
MRTPTKPSTRGPYITLRLAHSLAAFLTLWLSVPAAAQDDEPLAREPPRYLALVSAGIPMRLNVKEDYGQDRWGASFMDVLGGYVLPGGSYRHGFGLGLSWNLGHDGEYVEPIYTADQWVIMPAYLGYLQLGRDALVLGHVGVPIVLNVGAGLGVEVGAALAYHLFAGAGIFAEVDLSMYDAGDAGATLLASLEAGVLLNYEVLP